MAAYPGAARDRPVPPDQLARRRRRITTLAVVFMLAASACSEGGGSTSLKPGSRPFSSPSSVGWTGCGPAFQCGAVTVPLDYSNPTGDTIKIAIIRKPAADLAARIGSVVFNPGGPLGPTQTSHRRAHTGRSAGRARSGRSLRTAPLRFFSSAPRGTSLPTHGLKR